MKSVKGQNVSTVEIAWLAGIIEGEGYFGSGGRSGNSPIIGVQMVDEDTIQKVAKIFNRPYYKKVRQNYKEIYTVTIGSNQAIGWIFTIYSFLSYRRKSQALSVIDKWKNIPIRDELNFSCGHSRFQQGLVSKYKTKHCYICKNIKRSSKCQLEHLL